MLLDQNVKMKKNKDLLYKSQDGVRISIVGVGVERSKTYNSAYLWLRAEAITEQAQIRSRNRVGVKSNPQFEIF